MEKFITEDFYYVNVSELNDYRRYYFITNR